MGGGGGGRSQVQSLTVTQLSHLTISKYMGILLDVKLKLTSQLSRNTHNANNKLHLFKNIRHCLAQTSTLIVFKSMVLCFIEFGNALLLGCNEVDINKIQRAQNKGLRIALGRDRMYRTCLLYTDVRLAEWRVRARITLNKLMFKCKDSVSFIEDFSSRPQTRIVGGPIMCIDRPRNYGTATIVVHSPL